MESLTEMFRNAVSEGSDNGMLVAADALQDSDDIRNQWMGELLRCYVDIQTYVRTSMPIPLSLGQRYNDLQTQFNSKPTKAVTDSDWWNAEYYKPLGVYYLGLRVSLSTLNNMPNLLSTEPVRELEIRRCYTTGDALKTILRNYRMGYMQRLTLRFERGGPSAAAVSTIAEALYGTLGDMLESIDLLGIDDRMKKCQVMFMSAPKIRKGCRLSISRSAYGTPERADYTVTHK